MSATAVRGTNSRRTDFAGVKGIGRARAEMLRQLGVVSVRSLAEQDPEHLAGRLRKLYERGETTTNLEPMAADWVASARDLIARTGSWTEELGAFTLRFEAHVDATDDTEHRDYVCVVYDEKGAGEEASFDADPAQWAPYIVDRAGLAEPSHELNGHQPLQVTLGDPYDGGHLPVEVHADGLDRGEVIVVLVQDSGNGLRRVSGPLGADCTARLLVTPLEAGAYRVFTWVEGETDDHQYVQPSCGPLIRVHR
jgi:hypothetical protein